MIGLSRQQTPEFVASGSSSTAQIQRPNRNIFGVILANPEMLPINRCPVRPKNNSLFNSRLFSCVSITFPASSKMRIMFVVRQSKTILARSCEADRGSFPPSKLGRVCAVEVREYA
jgi:hypothetical protein